MSPCCAARRPSGTKSPTWSATRSTPALSTSPSLGGFDLAVNLPDNAALGYAQVNLQLVEAGDFEGTEYYHAFQIQEFRRPEFEVTARPEGEGPYFVGGEATVGVHAAYFAGGPLPNAGANWNVTAQPRLLCPAQLARIHLRHVDALVALRRMG